VVYAAAGQPSLRFQEAVPGDDPAIAPAAPSRGLSGESWSNEGAGDRLHFAERIHEWLWL